MPQADVSRHKGIAARMYCNACGTQYVAYAHHQRFCSAGCSSRFWAKLHRVAPTTDQAATQMRILAELRRLEGDWIERCDLVAAVYGIDDPASRHAFVAALHRLRATWADRGLIIGCRVNRLAIDRVSATRYRLERDIDQPSEEASA